MSHVSIADSMPFGDMGIQQSVSAVGGVSWSVSSGCFVLSFNLSIVRIVLDTCGNPFMAAPCSVRVICRWDHHGVGGSVLAPSAGSSNSVP